MKFLPFHLLLFTIQVLSQSQQQLQIGQVYTQPQSAPLPKFIIPSGSNLIISVALCASWKEVPKYWVTNSSVEQNGGSDGGQNTFEIPTENGSGSVSGSFPSGGLLVVEGDISGAPFEVGISSNGESMHQVLSSPPLLGDTTATQALIFSPPSDPPLRLDPAYPSYTLPPANDSMPSPPSSVQQTNFTILIQTTKDAVERSLPKTGCAIRNAANPTSGAVGTISSQQLWLKDSLGWRNQWVINGLSPATNYTVWVAVNGTKVSGPAYFVTKTASFNCPLLANLPFCPGISYSVPLPPPPDGLYGPSTLPDAISRPILDSLTNFTTTLTTFACGRDLYSPLQTCADCQRAYRDWLCLVSFPRCTEPRPGDNDSIAGASQNNGDDTQVPLTALQPQTTKTPLRNPNFPPLSTTFSNSQPPAILLPCIETCTAVDRACPSFLQFRCPVVKFNARDSYGVGYVDGIGNGEGEGSGDPDGMKQGATGVSQDIYGNVWCNGPAEF